MRDTSFDIIYSEDDGGYYAQFYPSFETGSIWPTKDLAFTEALERLAGA